MALSKARDGSNGEPLSATHDLEGLAALVDGRLRDEERAALVTHLAGCAECRDALALLARAGAAGLLALPSAAPHVSRSSFPPLHAWLPIAAALVLVVAGVTRLDWSPATHETTSPPAHYRPAKPPSPAVVVRPDVPTPKPRIDPVDPALLVKRGAGRKVAGKTFRLIAGEWVDSAFDPAAALPTTVARGPDQRAALLAQRPALAPYVTLGGRVVVVLEGTVYRWQP